jgi:arylsulfatase A-like enzyme
VSAKDPSGRLGRVVRNTSILASYGVVLAGSVLLAIQALRVWPTAVRPWGLLFWLVGGLLALGLACPWLAWIQRSRGAVGGRAAALFGALAAFGFLPALAVTTDSALTAWHVQIGLMLAFGVPAVASMRKAGSRRQVRALMSGVIAAALVAVWVWGLEGRDWNSLQAADDLFRLRSVALEAGLVLAIVVALGLWWVLAATAVRRRWAFWVAAGLGLAAWPGYLTLPSVLARDAQGLERLDWEFSVPTEPAGPLAGVKSDRAPGWAYVCQGDEWREALILEAPCRIETRLDLPAGGRLWLYATAPVQVDQGPVIPVRVRCTLRAADGRALSERQAVFGQRTIRQANDTWKALAEAPFALDAPGATLVVAVENAGVPRTRSRPLLIAVSARLDGPPPTAISGPNCVIILSDALRSDRLHCYGYPAATSPRLDALAAEGTLFERVVAPSSFTVPAVASLFTGTYPSTHGIHDLSVPGRLPMDTLPEQCRRAGMFTGGVSANCAVYPGSGLALGFDVFRGVDDAFASNPPHADWVTDYALSLLRAHHDRRFFLYLHYMDTHEPRNPPRKWATGYTVDQRYDGAVRYMDSEVERFLAELDRLGHRDDTLVVFLSDHGEGLGEHGVVNHAFSVHREEIQVPLILWYPGHVPAGRRVRSQVRSLDAYPTICELLGLPVPRCTEGEALQALFPDGADTADRTAFSELHVPKMPVGVPQAALVDGTNKLILNLDGSGRALYDTLADPDEQFDVAGQRPEITATLDRRLQQFLRERRRAADRRAAPLNDEAKRRLRALGYFVPGDK